MPVVPHRLLFRYALPIQQVSGLPKKGRKLLGLPERCRLPDLAELDGAPSFAAVRLAWNSGGLGVSVVVSGKKIPPQANVAAPADGDGLQVWIDTRNTQSIHRATRFCHHFCLLPNGAGAGFDRPIAVQLPIARSRDDVLMVASEKIPIKVALRRDGYELDAWLPAEALHGFDPEANPRLGFYWHVHDSELGDQSLSVGREFPFAHDPSLWSTLELQQ